MLKVRGCTFDATGTLFRPRNSIGVIYYYAAQKYRLPVQEFHIEKLDTAFNNLYQRFDSEMPNFGLSANISSKEWWKRLVNATFREAQVIPPDGNVDMLFEQLFEDFTKAEMWEVYREVPHVLQTLRSRGKRLGVISNFDERLNTILENLNLRQYFDFVLISREFGVTKPSKEIFREAKLLSGITDGTLLHVGDHPVKDFDGAQKAGVLAVLLTRKPTQQLRNNVPIISDLTALLNIIS
jgi:putative hydrolase of the HAD superfamily